MISVELDVCTNTDYKKICSARAGQLSRKSWGMESPRRTDAHTASIRPIY